jgi:predicted kinase
MTEDKKSIIDILIHPESCLDFFFITGLPGAGKSTFASKEIFKNCFEADHWMVDEQGNYKFNREKLKYCHSQCLKATENAMKLEKDPIIVSNTSLTKKEAKPYFLLAKKYKYNIVLVHLMTEYKSVHEVPESKIQQMKNRRQIYKIKEII